MKRSNVALKQEEAVQLSEKNPPRYKVLLLNDDVTPVDWVIELLTTVFKHSPDTAEFITLTVHQEGSAVAGTYTYEIAEQKAIEATLQSKARGFPLALQLEKE
jgi:ATP-dependent Clp protease adaptor protein ClpS